MRCQLPISSPQGQNRYGESSRPQSATANTTAVNPSRMTSRIKFFLILLFTGLQATAVELSIAPELSTSGTLLTLLVGGATFAAALIPFILIALWLFDLRNGRLW